MYWSFTKTCKKNFQCQWIYPFQYGCRTPVSSGVCQGCLRHEPMWGQLPVPYVAGSLPHQLALSPSLSVQGQHWGDSAHHGGTYKAPFLLFWTCVWGLLHVNHIYIILKLMYICTVYWCTFEVGVGGVNWFLLSVYR